VNDETTNDYGRYCHEIETSCSSINNLTVCAVSEAAVSEINGHPFNCFWLYDSNTGNSGSCRAKDDSSLTCTQAKRSTQCTQSGVTKLGDNCYWLEQNGSTPGECINKV
jgi:hypothetical protein